MYSQVFLKNIILSSGSKAVIKSKWQEQEDKIKITIFIKENDENHENSKNTSILTGEISQEKLRKKKEEISVDFETIKDSLTSNKNENKSKNDENKSIRFEIDEKRKKFIVSAEENSDSQSGFRDIYVRMDVEKVGGEDLVKIMMEVVDEMMEMSKLKDTVKEQEEQLKEMLTRYEKLQNEKNTRDKEILPKFMALLNSKKEKIAKLERQVDKKQNFNKSNKFLNLSSDLDQSDISIQDPKSVSSKNISSQELISSQDIPSDPQPSTSKAVLESPVRKKPDLKSNTPKSSTKSPRRFTPRKSKTLQPKGLFQFEQDSDSDDVLKPQKTPVKTQNDSLLDGLSLKITRKLRSSQEENPSSAELFAPRILAKKRSKSPDSRSKKSTTPEFLEAAQTLNSEDESLQPLKRQKTEKIVKSQKSQIENEIFTQDLTEDVIQSSQNDDLDSPSIFQSYGLRKAKKTPTKTSQMKKKSVFSIDTQDIFNDLSP